MFCSPNLYLYFMHFILKKGRKKSLHPFCCHVSARGTQLCQIKKNVATLVHINLFLERDDIFIRGLIPIYLNKSFKIAIGYMPL